MASYHIMLGNNGNPKALNNLAISGNKNRDEVLDSIVMSINNSTIHDFNH